MIGIVVAIGREISDFSRAGKFDLVTGREGVRFLESAHLPNVVLAQGGAGRDRAQRATRLLVDRYDPDLIVSAGFAGAAKPGARPGDLYICSRILALCGPPTTWNKEATRSRTLMDEGLMTRLSEAIDGVAGGCAWGETVTVDQIVHSRALKRWIGESFGADVIDMESYWVSEVAAERGLPHMVVRSVMDPMEQSLPTFVMEATEQERSRTLASGARHMLGNPTDLVPLLRLWHQVRRASRRLTDVLASVVTAEAWTPAYRLGVT